MRDRQVFDQIKLKNGITVYSYPMEEVDFFSAHLVVPIGHGNNTDGIIPGSAHMLEHMLMNRSKLHPKLNEYKELLGLKGGYSNAGTSIDDTSYDIDCPSTEFESMWPGFLARPLQPLLSEEDLQNERGVVANERNRRRWFPGNTELGHYLLTEWKSYNVSTLEQRLGSNEDLGSMTVESLSNLQKNYYDPRMYLVIGGKFDMGIIRSSIESIETKKRMLPQKIGLTEWKHKDYHEKKFKDVNNMMYMTNAIFHERADFQTMRGMTFIFNLLTNNVHNNLHHWLREEKGWTYGLSYHISNNIREWSWSLDIPLDEAKHVQAVREELHERIITIISNQDMVSSEVDRIIKSEVFSYQTLDDILDSAMDDLGDYGQIYSEKEFIEAKERCRDVVYLRQLYDSYIAPPNAGEFCALPEDK
jgi:predicted Zn-dependent peptidase